MDSNTPILTMKPNDQPVPTPVVKPTPHQRLRQVIVRTLDRYPNITRSMLASHASPYGSQYGISWSDILDELIAEGIVIQEAVVATGRGRRATVNYRLSPPVVDDAEALTG